MTDTLILDAIEQAKRETLSAIAAAASPAELEQIRIATLGRNGWLKRAWRELRPQTKYSVTDV